jgi:type I restriction enzyme M protein
MAKTNANLIWKIADLLRGPYQPNQAKLGGDE